MAETAVPQHVAMAAKDAGSGARTFALSRITRSFRGPNGNVEAVRGVDLTVSPGSFLALHGRSGCGKTTLLLIAGGLLAPSSGEVSLGDTNPYALAPNARASWRARHVGFVFQQINLVPYLNVLENVLSPSLARREEGQRERALALLEQFGMNHRLDHLPSALSTGEQQRVGLARAVLNRPAVLLADEPTGNLDEENAGVVLRFFQDYASEGGIVLMVTHDLEARAAATRALEMKEGRIVDKPSK